MPRHRHRSLPCTPGPAGDPGGELLHYPHGGRGSQQGKVAMIMDTTVKPLYSVALYNDNTLIQYFGSLFIFVKTTSIQLILYNVDFSLMINNFISQQNDNFL